MNIIKLMCLLRRYESLAESKQKNSNLKPQSQLTHASMQVTQSLILYMHVFVGLILIRSFNLLSHLLSFDSHEVHLGLHSSITFFLGSYPFYNIYFTNAKIEFIIESWSLLNQSYIYVKKSASSYYKLTWTSDMWLEWFLNWVQTWDEMHIYFNLILLL